MADWRQEIDSLFKSQGFEKKIPDLTPEDETTIQQFLDNIGKPALQNICDQLNSYLNIKAEVVAEKERASSIMEMVRLNISRMNQPKLTYRLKFQKDDKGINLVGECSVPNIYGENTRFEDSGLQRPMQGTTEEEIASDLSAALKSKF